MRVCVSSHLRSSNVEAFSTIPRVKRLFRFWRWFKFDQFRRGVVMLLSCTAFERGESTNLASSRFCVAWAWGLSRVTWAGWRGGSLSVFSVCEDVLKADIAVRRASSDGVDVLCEFWGSHDDWCSKLWRLCKRLKVMKIDSCIRLWGCWYDQLMSRRWMSLCINSGKKLEWKCIYGVCPKMSFLEENGLLCRSRPVTAQTDLNNYNSACPG